MRLKIEEEMKEWLEKKEPSPDLSDSSTR